MVGFLAYRRPNFRVRIRWRYNFFAGGLRNFFAMHRWEKPHPDCTTLRVFNSSKILMVTDKLLRNILMTKVVKLEWICIHKQADRRVINSSTEAA
ncbi:protein of unknown function [Candidatus Filomicrobium marinum]|nr:protein of unknown function [Candidatus Filomicrobium marinum]